MEKTLVVGLDSACWKRLSDLVEQGNLPNLADLQRSGTSGIIHSTSPPMTPPAWTSMVTGMGPARHGILDFLSMDPETHRITPIGAMDLDVPAIWDVFQHEGQRIAILNLPMIFPPPDVNDCFLTGIPFEVEDNIAHPRWLQNAIEKADYSVHPREAPDDHEAYLAELERLIPARTEIALAVLEKEDVDLLWATYMAIDWAQHYLWNHESNGENAVDHVYRLLDKQIGVLRDAVGDDWNMVVVSDHGATTVEHELHLNSLLKEWELLDRHDAGQGYGWRRLLDRTLDLGTNLPEQLKSPLRRVITTERHTRLREIAGRDQLGMSEEIEWGETVVFSYGYMGQLHVNRSDWYAQGIVSPEDYQAIRNDIVDRFEDLSHPETNEPLIDAAKSADDLYGETGPQIPDVVLEPVDWNVTMYGDFGDPWICSPSDRVADHAPEGIFIAAGPAFTDEKDELNMDIVDVAPTLLYLHQLPVPVPIDGAIRTDLFDKDFTDANEVRREEMNVESDTLRTNDRTDEIEGRLEDLGYL